MRLGIGLHINRRGGGSAAPTITDLAVSEAEVATATISEAGTAYYVWSTGSAPAAATLKSDAITASQTLTITAGANSGSLLNYPTTSGTWYLYMVLQTAGGVYSNVAASNAIVISAYAYTWVTTNGTAYSSITPASASPSRVTLAMAINITSFGSYASLLQASGIADVFIDNATKTLHVEWKDGLAAAVFNSVSTETFSAATNYDLYIALDFVSNTISCYRNGTALTMTGAITPGITQTKQDVVHSLARASWNAPFDGDIAYFWLDYRTTANLGPTSFYDGGPLDLSGLATPTIWRGHLMTADAESGDTSHGWNDAYNKGSASGMSVPSATYTD